MTQRLAYRHDPTSKTRPWLVVVMPRGKKVVGRYKTLDQDMRRIMGKEWDNALKKGRT